MLAAARAHLACGGPTADETLRPPCPTPRPALASGELVAGQDPAALLDPYWGSFVGTLTWADGGDTPFTLSLAPGSDPRVYASPPCTRATAVYTYPNLGLTTEDGGLDETDTTILDVPLPGSPFAPSFNVLSPSVLSDSQWHGAIRSHLPSNNLSYYPRGLLPAVEWKPGEPQPTSLLLYFYATPQGTTDTDHIIIASVVFP